MFVGWKEKKGEKGRRNLIFFAFLLVVKQLFTIFAAEFNKDKELMKRRHVLICLILLLVAACCVGLWGWRLLRADRGQVTVHIDRFDRVLDAAAGGPEGYLRFTSNSAQARGWSSVTAKPF